MERDYKNIKWKVVNNQKGIYNPKLIIKCSKGWNVAEIIGSRDKKIIEQDAKLMASAPELLVSAIDLVKHLTEIENGKWLNNLVGENLKSAIKKATI